MGSQKPKLVRRFLIERSWAAVVLSDTDTVWLRNPEPYLALHPSADVFISTDCLSHQVPCQTVAFVDKKACQIVSF